VGEGKGAYPSPPWRSRRKIWGVRRRAKAKTATIKYTQCNSRERLRKIHLERIQLGRGKAQSRVLGRTPFLVLMFWVLPFASVAQQATELGGAEAGEGLRTPQAGAHQPGDLGNAQASEG